MTEARLLGVRGIPPAERHARILETFEALVPGSGFGLVNDHDPKPLYYQFAAERAGAFTWDYREPGSLLVLSPGVPHDLRASAPSYVLLTGYLEPEE